MTQVAVSGAAVEFGATTLFKDITFTIAAGERWGVVGRNGTGKTTLFKLADRAISHPSRAGRAPVGADRLAARPASRLRSAPRRCGRRRPARSPSCSRSSSRSPNRRTRWPRTHDEAALTRYGRDLERFEREGGYTIAPRVDAVLQGLGFDAAKARTQPLEQLSGGERGRVGLARQLVAPSDILLLDEPTNHLDLETTRWLEQYLRETRAHGRPRQPRPRLPRRSGRPRPALRGRHGDAVRRAATRRSSQQRQERRLAQQRAFDKQQKVIAARGRLHRAQHRRPEHQAGEGAAEAAGAPAAAQRAGR